MSCTHSPEQAYEHRRSVAFLPRDVVNLRRKPFLSH